MCSRSRNCWPRPAGVTRRHSRSWSTATGASRTAHCYRTLGSVQDAEDGLQESLLAAWRGLSGFEGRSSLRTWLYRISTNDCLRLAARRRRRILSPDHGPPRSDTADLGEPVTGPVWLEPWPDDEPAAEPGDVDPELRYPRRESVEPAFVAALQHLPGTQRAVLILREAIGTDGRRELVDAFMTAWERADVPALLKLLTEDARFTMPPLPAWFDGREDVGRFFAERVFATPWRLVPLRANGQPGFACYLREPGSDTYRLRAINLLGLRAGRIAEITGSLDPELHRHLGVPLELPDKESRPER
jgi:RNA polymerase sigma factor (sigma-70 family)